MEDSRLRPRVHNALFASTAKLHCVWEAYGREIPDSGTQRRGGRSCIISRWTRSLGCKAVVPC